MFIDEKLRRIVHMAQAENQTAQAREGDWCSCCLLACLWHVVEYIQGFQRWEVLQASPDMPAFSHVRCLLFLFAFASSRYRIVSSSFCSIHSRRERIHERDLSHLVP